MQHITIAMALALAVSAGYAADVDELVDAGDSWLIAQRDAQEKVDELASETRDLEAEYQRVLRQIEGLEAYNRQLRKQIGAQEKEIARTDESIAKATEVDRQLLPLLNDMVDGYARLVAVSPPFLPDERDQRIAFLQDVVDRADVSAAEKFRQVLDAYMTELNYGSSIEAYVDVIQVAGAERDVSVLRLGRIGLYYQTADREHTGRWDDEMGQWVKLGSGYRNGVYEAIRVANKLTAPSLLSLPLPPAQSAESGSGQAGAETGPPTDLARLTRQEAQ